MSNIRIVAIRGLTFFGVLFVMMSTMAQFTEVKLPERMTLRLEELEFCPNGSRTASEVESLLAQTLSKHATMLQRGEIKEVIEKEQLESMGGQFDEDRTVEFGALEGAQAIVSASLNCRGHMQVLTVSITSVETTRLLYTNSFYGEDLTHAVRLLDQDISRSVNSKENPLAGMSEDQLMSNVFDLEVVDYLFADSWSKAIEQAIFSGLKDFDGGQKFSANGVVKVTMHSDEFGVMHSQVKFNQPKSRKLTAHLQSQVNDVPLSIAPKYDNRILQVQSELSWPLQLNRSENESILFNGRSGRNAMPWEGELSGAPRGRYILSLHSVRLGMREFNANELLEGRGRRESTSFILSGIIPGAGIGYGTFRSEKGSRYLLVVGGFAGVAIGARWMARNQYSLYQNASTEQEAISTYNAANRWHHASLILSGCTAVSWSWNLIDTLRKVRAHNQRIQSFMSIQ